MAMGKHGAKQGGNTGSMEFSPARKRRRRKQLRAQEARWAARSGPVTVTKIGSDGEDGHPEALDNGA